ncbi:hypothetical protein GCM10010981_08130 [Dyella nitratireducens]|uniref:Uncharacterized protein n=1 Tax=Dyella nitratireducens TaxID=1849580 RepID=A0ABQ1FM97_9GAMM|nr:hypothetical protein GCM10010981_08130 [Dyella nitratireducens]GLQ44127.1 hypothetical protein GCM10007902_39770 [Dyella nitratireducens]
MANLSLKKRPMIDVKGWIGQTSGCSDEFCVGVTGTVRSQTTGPSAKSDWPSVETMGRRYADGQCRPEG